MRDSANTNYVGGQSIGYHLRPPDAPTSIRTTMFGIESARNKAYKSV